MEDARLFRLSRRGAVVVGREAVLGLLRLGARIGAGGGFGQPVALGHVGTEQRLQELQGAAPVGDHVGHFHVDAATVVAHAEEHALGPGVQAVADGQVLGGHARRGAGRFQVMPEHAASQRHVEAGELRHGGVQRALQRLLVNLVDHGGRQAEDGLVRASRLGGVELADVV